MRIKPILKRISVLFEENYEVISILLMVAPVIILIALIFIIPGKIIYFVGALPIFFIGLGIDWHFDRKRHQEFRQKMKRVEIYLRLKEKQKRRDEILMWTRFYYLMCKDDENEVSQERL